MDNYEKLLKLMEYIDIEEGEDGLYIDIKENILLNHHGNVINKIKGNFVLVTNAENKGLIYLNPQSVRYDDDESITQIYNKSYKSLVENQKTFQENKSEQQQDCSDCDS